MPFNWEEVSRDSDEYEMCRLEVSAISLAAGGMLGALGTPLTGGLSVPVLMAAGGVMGLAAGYLACPYLPPLIKKKLLGGNELTHMETRSAIEAMQKYTGLTDAKKTVGLLAEIRPKLAGMSDGAKPHESLVKLAGATANRVT